MKVILKQPLQACDKKGKAYEKFKQLETIVGAVSGKYEH